MAREYTIRIGGAAGQGIQFIGGLLARCLSVEGFHVHTHQDYMSRIKGGHNFYQIRIANYPVASSRNKIDILLALNQLTLTGVLSQYNCLSIKKVLFCSAAIRPLDWEHW
jgi:Pyruvate/2-oxoacid:ferredoxin oxidoreductase gamma subunit